MANSISIEADKFLTDLELGSFTTAIFSVYCAETPLTFEVNGDLEYFDISSLKVIDYAGGLEAIPQDVMLCIEESLLDGSLMHKCFKLPIPVLSRTKIESLIKELEVLKSRVAWAPRKLMLLKQFFDTSTDLLQATLTKPAF